MKERLEKINYLLLFILPFVDIVTALSTRLIQLPVSLGIVIKGLYTVALVIYIMFFCKNKEKKHFIYYLIAIFLYCVLFILTKKHIWNMGVLFKEFVSLYKYLFTGLLLFSYIVIYRNQESSKKINKVMFYTLICYVVLLIVPEITNTSFSSYAEYIKNDGSVGWFYAANEIGAILLILFPFYFSKLKTMIEEKKYWYLLLIVPIIYAIYLLGTKASWYGLILICIATTIIYIFKERKNRKLILFLIVTVISLFILNMYSPASDNLNQKLENSNKPVVTNKDNSSDKESNSNKNNSSSKENSSNKNSFANLKCGKYHKIKEIIPNKKITKMINVLFSGRENKAYTQFLIYKDSSLANKLFGLGFTNNEEIDNCYIEIYIEVDLFDSIVHFGIIGFIILLFPFGYLISTIKFKNIKKLDSVSMIYIFTFILLIAFSFASGHLLGYPSPSIYLCLLMVLIANNMDNLKLGKN